MLGLRRERVLRGEESSHDYRNLVYYDHVSMVLDDPTCSTVISVRLGRRSVGLDRSPTAWAVHPDAGYTLNQ